MSAEEFNVYVISVHSFYRSYNGYFVSSNFSQGMSKYKDYCNYNFPRVIS